MEKIPLQVPTFLYPKKDLQNPCPCQDRPVELTHKTCLIFWQKKAGERVCVNEVLAEVEADKKTMELCSPCCGVLAETCVEDGGEFAFGEVLGYLSREEEG